MRTLLITVWLLGVAGCASQGYQGTEGTYTVYRSRMMTPDGVLSDRHLDKPLFGPRDIDESPTLPESYSAYRR